MKNRIIAWATCLAACSFCVADEPSTQPTTQAFSETMSKIPTLHETPQQHDERMAWWRDAKFGMFIHWGPCTVGDREIGWGRNANRPMDNTKDRVGPRTDDLEYDNYYKQFNPVRFDPDKWVSVAKAAGMKYMVLIAKHHDGFSMFDTQLGDYKITRSPYGKDIVKQFVDACHRGGMKVGLYYSTRDWYHPDYLVGDNARYDAWYRGQVEELLSRYGQVDVMWFDHVGGRDWSKWRFDELFAMMYAKQPKLIVNDRAARFCGPQFPTDQGPASPEIRKITAGDFSTPEGRIGKMELARDWESCIILSPTPKHDGWSYRSEGKTRPLDEVIRMLVSTTSGGGNLLLNFGPDQFGEFRPEESAIAEGVGEWLKTHGQSIYETRGGPFLNGQWGGSTHRGKTVYLHVFDSIPDTLTLPALPQNVRSAKRLVGGQAIAFEQDDKGAITLTIPRALRETTVTVIELTLDRDIERGQVQR